MVVKASDFGINTDNLPKEQKEFMEKMLGLMCDVINKSAQGSPPTTSDSLSEHELIKKWAGRKFCTAVDENKDQRC